MVVTSLQRILWLAACLCVTAGVSRAADAPRGRRIEFSAPRDERGETNKPSLPGHSSLLDQMEADLNRPFKSIIGGDSLSGMVLTAPQPLPPPAIQSPRAKALSKRDQMYLTPEEMFPVTSLEDMSKTYELTPDGRKKSELRPLERRMMEALNPVHPLGPTNQIGGFLTPAYGNSDAGAFPGINGTSKSFGTANPGGRSLNKLFDESPSPTRTREAMDNKELFGFGAPSQFGSKLTRSEVQRRDAFMQIMNPNYVAPIEGALPNPGTISTPYVDSSFYDPPKAVITPSTSLSGTAGSAANLLPYTPTYVPPAPAPVRPTPPPAPTSPFMNIPQRNF